MGIFISIEMAGYTAITLNKNIQSYSSKEFYHQVRDYELTYIRETYSISQLLHSIYNLVAGFNQPL